MCPKADALFPIVSAASIAAKVSRDRALEELKDVEGGLRSCFGSGYPADPDTKAWLEGHVHPVFGFPSVARFSWSTCTALMDKHCTKVDWECDEGDQRSLQETLAGGAGRCGTKTTLRDRHSFFRARKLQRVHAGW